MPHPGSTRRTLAAILGANALPVVGVLALDWTVSTVLALYWLETGVLVARGGVEGLFAGRPPATEAGGWAPFEDLADKRGGVVLYDALGPLYPRNVPVAVGALWLVLLVWPLGGVGLSVVGPDRLLAPGSAPTVAVALAGIVVSNAVGLAAAVRRGRYDDRPVHAAIPQGRIVGLVALILAAGAFANPPETATVAGTSLVFGVVVAVKLCLDVGAFLAARGSVPVLSRLAARTQESAPEEPAHVPTGDPAARVRTDRTAVRLRAVGLGIVSAVLPPSGLVAFGGAFLTWAFHGTLAAVALALAVLAVAVLVRVVEQDVLFGHLEYRIYDEGVLAYDRLLDAPQWFVPTHDIADTRTSDGLLGHRFGYDTGVLRLQRRDGGDARLVFLDDADRVLATVDR
ncbi:DUF6498-containing protein [Haloarchaeobius iranensis]|uniref:Uncharacterized protein n=1 Tax=Haloarchaeobius iranensis TaxID=996166 RepID=A0A1G9V2V3_9EURY|nr:DUF6498-containing protein [Haloarchaeobius iranensis]SDM66413.1 hypothetical protein SAMN05192554_105157 [Haloarchaeobius iranensis]